MRRFVPPTCALLTAFAALLFALPIAVRGQSPTGAPLVSYQNVQEGAVLSEQPYAFQFCFSEPVNIVTPGTDYNFELDTPEGIQLSHRTVFQPNGLGVSIYPATDIPVIPPGIPSATAQVWSFHWMVTAAGDHAATEGVIHFSLSKDATAIPHESTSACVGGLPPGAGNTGGSGGGGSSDSGGRDILPIVLIVVGVVTGLAIAVGIVLVIRQRRKQSAPPG